MAIEFECPGCGSTLRVGNDSSGSEIRCGGCLTRLRVPAQPPHNPSDEVRTPLPETAEDRDRDYDDERSRPQRRRVPPPPPGRGIFFWLVLLGGGVMLGIIGCCGGLFLLIPGPKWKTHESAKGGFKVDLPAPPRNDMEALAGAKNDPTWTMEGTILVKRLEEFAIIYREIARGIWQRPTDDKLIEDTIQGLRSNIGIKQVLRKERIAVSGFPACEVELRDASGAWYTARIVIADTRLYVVIAGGQFAKPGNENVRRFLDSFQIMDPKLKPIGKKNDAVVKPPADSDDD